MFDFRLFVCLLAFHFRLAQIRTILANSTFNINELVGKTSSDDDSDDADNGDDDDDECIGSDGFYFTDHSELRNLYVVFGVATNEFIVQYDDVFNCSEFAVKEEDGRISLAYERLSGIPKSIADKFALRTHTLDLSYNTIM